MQMEVKEQIERLRNELHRHNYNYYVLNAPTIDDRTFDEMMHELQGLEEAFPQYLDPNSPTQRVGNDINRSFSQVEHRYPMLSFEQYLFDRRSIGILRTGSFGIDGRGF